MHKLPFTLSDIANNQIKSMCVKMCFQGVYFLKVHRS